MNPVPFRLPLMLLAGLSVGVVGCRRTPTSAQIERNAALASVVVSVQAVMELDHARDVSEAVTQLSAKGGVAAFRFCDTGELVYVNADASLYRQRGSTAVLAFLRYRTGDGEAYAYALMRGSTWPNDSGFQGMSEADFRQSVRGRFLTYEGSAVVLPDELGQLRHEQPVP